MLMWCSYPGKNKKSWEGIDGIIGKYLARKYKCDGYIIKGMKTYSIPKEKVIDYQTEIVIVNSKRKLEVLYDDRQPLEVTRLKK